MPREAVLRIETRTSFADFHPDCLLERARLYKRHLAVGNPQRAKSAGSITAIIESLHPGPVTLYALPVDFSAKWVPACEAHSCQGAFRMRDTVRPTSEAISSCGMPLGGIYRAT